MAEYIERGTIKYELWAVGPLNSPLMIVRKETIDGIPVADVVELAHSKWVDHGVRDWRCFNCGEKIKKVRNVDGYCYNDKPNYCPNCGARMDGERYGTNGH